MLAVSLLMAIFSRP